ncbi:hypothetical protein RirG_051260 [Rhizophagus irregularis DAOM 197198w]|uniref:Endonuclease/exonuclease/phosphatase domain-containing protein n=3 Tax=Rhizophagus irregularis TaxID=588596 RepID=A0A015J646_RHIIW|nr:hypothetical protein RirG_163960 [Rhizophagus irregularis DAOM 197198w]EXX74417.1 hypothetical protein RirG_051260 [Rhizophagus irregularis DAOM 197198w]
MEEEVTTNTKVIIADKIQVITILKGNKEDTDNITKDTTHNIDNRHDDQMHIDLMEKVTTFITNLMIRDLHPTQEIIDTTNIIKNSEKAEEIMTEDQTDEDPTTTEITILNKDIIDTYNNIIITEEKHIITEEKKSTEESKTIDIMMMDTNIDEQTMTMIEEEKTGSIMDIDIESTSRTISIHEEETWDVNDTLKNYIEKNKKVKNKKTDKNTNNTKINNKIKIGCINIRGLNADKETDNKQERLKNFIKKENWDIAGINETKIKKSKGKYIYKEWENMKIRNNSAEEEKSKGSQILIQKYWTEVRTINYQEIEGYAQSIDIRLKGNKKSIRIINIYMVGNNKNKKKEIISIVDRWINEGKNENLDVIVMGDFNERRQNKGKKNKNILLEMIDSHNMVDIHYFFNNEDLIDTWTNRTISTRIDYIFVNSEMLQRIEEHEVLNVENKLLTDHKALTITIKIDNETTSSTNNKRKDTGHFRNKFSGKEWEEIAERVENSIIERQMDIDENVESNEEVTSEIDKKWTKLKNVITKVITETKQEIRTKTNTTMNTKKEYNSNINEMSDCDRVKTKLKIIKEIEQCWKKWNKLTMEKNESNVKTRWNLDMMENFGARERKVITKYKILVHRFNDICNMKMTTEAFKQNITLHDNLEDSTSINIAKIKLEKEKSRLLCDMVNVQKYEQSLAIEKNIEKREQLMTTDLKEMIIRIIDKRRGQIKIDSCQKISEDRVRMITNHEEIKDEVVEHYKNWTCTRNFDEEEFNKNWKHYYDKLETVDEHIYDHLCEEVTLIECDLTLNNVKNDKAAGASGIPYDFWKKSGHHTKKALIDIINLVIIEGTWPTHVK